MEDRRWVLEKYQSSFIHFDAALSFFDGDLMEK